MMKIKTFIGIANSFTDVVPGHIHLRDLVEYAMKAYVQLRNTI